MKPYATPTEAVTAVHRLIPRVGRAFSLLPEEIAKLRLSADLFLQPSFTGRDGEGRSLPNRNDIQQVLRTEALRILVRRQHGRTTRYSPSIAAEARWIIAQVEAALPEGSEGRLVLDVTLERRDLRTQVEYRMYERGIPILSKAIRECLSAVYGSETAAMFRRSIGALLMGAGSGVTRDPLMNAVDEFRTKQGEKAYWARLASLDSESQYVLFSLQNGSPRNEVRKAFDEKYRSDNSTHAARWRFDTHIRAIEEGFGLLD